MRRALRSSYGAMLMSIFSGASSSLQSKEPLPARHRACAIVIGVAAVAWLTWLSGWLGVKPGTVLTKHSNVLFSSDTSLWMLKMWGKPTFADVTHLIHPLQIFFWSRPCRAAGAVAGIFLPYLDAQIFGARLFVATIAGTGIAFLAWLALRNGIRTVECLTLFVMYFLFTSNATICLPEHFGISNGLLTVAFVAPLLAASSRVRLFILGIMIVPIGGTTITNAIFPILSLIQSGLKSARLRLGALAVGSSIALGGAYLASRHSAMFHTFIDTYMRWRFVHDPLATGAYLFYFLVSPAIGPRPLIVQSWAGPMVSYEPVHGSLSLTCYFGIQAIGAIAWAVLLCRCALAAYRRPAARPAVKLLVGWLLFNCVLHNVWGDELLLYSAHWSWALMALVVLGAPRLSRAFVVTAALVVIVCQIPTLLAIKRALETIVT